MDTIKEIRKIRNDDFKLLSIHGFEEWSLLVTIAEEKVSHIDWENLYKIGEHLEELEKYPEYFPDLEDYKRKEEKFLYLQDQRVEIFTCYCELKYGRPNHSFRDRKNKMIGIF